MKKRNKNRSKRTLALFLALVMCLSMLQITAFAADGDAAPAGAQEVTGPAEPADPPQELDGTTDLPQDEAQEGPAQIDGIDETEEPAIPPQNQDEIQTELQDPEVPVPVPAPGTAEEPGGSTEETPSQNEDTEPSGGGAYDLSPEAVNADSPKEGGSTADGGKIESVTTNEDGTRTIVVTYETGETKTVTETIGEDGKVTSAKSETVTKPEISEGLASSSNELTGEELKEELNGNFGADYDSVITDDNGDHQITYTTTEKVDDKTETTTTVTVTVKANGTKEVEGETVIEVVEVDQLPEVKISDGKDGQPVITVDGVIPSDLKLTKSPDGGKTGTYEFTYTKDGIQYTVAANRTVTEKTESTAPVEIDEEITPEKLDAINKYEVNTAVSEEFDGKKLDGSVTDIKNTADGKVITIEFKDDDGSVITKTITYKNAGTTGGIVTGVTITEPRPDNRPDKEPADPFSDFLYSDGTFLGDAANFGIFANDYYQYGDTEVNVAVGTFHTGGQHFGQSGNYQGDKPLDSFTSTSYKNNTTVNYIGKVDGSSLQLHNTGVTDSAGNAVKSDLVLGPGYTKKDNLTYIQDGKTLQIGDNGTHFGGIYVADQSNAINIGQALSNLAAYADNLQKVGSDADLKNNTISFKEGSSSSSTHVINISFEDLKKETEIKITGMPKGSNLVVNVTGLDADATPSSFEFMAKLRFDSTTDGEGQIGGAHQKANGSIMYNFGSYSGTVKMGRNGGGQGCVLAPKATIVTDNHNGNIIANAVHANGSSHANLWGAGENHKVPIFNAPTLDVTTSGGKPTLPSATQSAAKTTFTEGKDESAVTDASAEKQTTTYVKVPVFGFTSEKSTISKNLSSWSITPPEEPENPPPPPPENPPEDPENPPEDPENPPPPPENPPEDPENPPPPPENPPEDPENPPPPPETPVTPPEEPEIPDEPTPLAGIPPVEEPESPVEPAPVEEPETIPDPPVPLADIPDERVPMDLVVILDDDVPLADVPATGDISGAWYALTALAACGLLVLCTMKKDEENA